MVPPLVRGPWRTPLSDLSRNSRSTLPMVPNLAISACSKAALAVVALLEQDRCQPRSSRV